MEEIRSLILRVTERCNLKCAYCYASDSGCVMEDMSADTAIRAVELCCPEGGSLRIQFTGGEPLLNMEVMEAVYAFGRATSRRLSLAVQSNGTLLTKDNCYRLAAMNCAVGVSLDGVQSANDLRHFPDGTPSFEATVQGIRNLGDAGKRCNLTTVVTNTNAKDLGKLPDLALWLGNVSGVGLDLFRPLGRGCGLDLAPAEADLCDGLTELIRKTKEIQSAGIPFRLRELERLKKRTACSGCSDIYCYAQTEQSLCVDAAGNCWPCSSLTGKAGFLLGNIRNGLPEISCAAASLKPTDTCKKCSSFSYCVGGCPAGRTALGGEPDPMTCVMNRILLEEFKL